MSVVGRERRKGEEGNGPVLHLTERFRLDVAARRKGGRKKKKKNGAGKGERGRRTRQTGLRHDAHASFSCWWHVLTCSTYSTNEVNLTGVFLPREHSLQVKCASAQCRLSHSAWAWALPVWMCFLGERPQKGHLIPLGFPRPASLRGMR